MSPEMTQTGSMIFVKRCKNSCPGSCPCDPDDEGNPANCVTLRLTVGDPSGSHSERWNFEVFEEATGRDVVCHCDDGFGTPGSAEYSLVKGKAYTFKLRWVATDPAYTGTPKPDYDWRAFINDSTEEGARSGLYGTGAFIVEDPDDLLQDEKHGNETDITIGKQGRIIVPKVTAIEPDSMANLAEMDDGDGNPKTRVFVVPIAQAMEFPVIPVTVRATLTPSLSESQLPAGWTLQNGEGSEKLTRTVNRSVSAGASKTEFTFTCGGTDSGFKTTVYVYDAKVGLYADEGDLQNIDIGHSWGRYSLDVYARELIPMDLRPYLQEVGFWPSIPKNGNCAGDVRLGAGAVGGHLPSGWKEYPVPFSFLSLALPQVKASDDNPPWYNLFNYNCTDYAIGIGESVNIYTMDASGVSTPWAFSNWLNTH